MPPVANVAALTDNVYVSWFSQYEIDDITRMEQLPPAGTAAVGDGPTVNRLPGQPENAWFLH